MIEGVAMKKQKIKLNKKQQQTVDLIQSGVNVFLQVMLELERQR